MFVNTVTADDKYPVRDPENLQFPIQIQLSQKRKTFSQILVPFMEFSSNFKVVEINDDGHSQCISEIADCQKLL